MKRESGMPQNTVFNEQYQMPTQRQDVQRERKPVKKYTTKHQLLRLPWLLLIVVGFLIPKIAANYASGIEKIYSREIYPIISGIIASITSYIPVSVAEILIILIPALLVIILLVRLLNLTTGSLLKKHKNRIKFFSYLISLGIFFGIMLNLFYAIWGLNYFREPLADSLELNVKERSMDELAQAYEELAKRAAELRDYVSEDESGVYTIGDHDEAFESVVEAYREMGTEHDIFLNSVYKAKSVKLSEYMSKAGIAGIYIPYTAEMNVNVNQPDLYILSGAAHETAHYMGFAREDEANFLAFYAAIFSDNVDLKYSAVMHALVNCGNKLYEKDAETYFAIREQYYTPGMYRDLDDYRQYIDKYEKETAQKVNDSMNDAYLKHNGLEDGIESYGRMVDLILAYFDAINVIDGE